jgi:hypothetical protein
MKGRKAPGTENGRTHTGLAGSLWYPHLDSARPGAGNPQIEMQDQRAEETPLIPRLIQGGKQPVTQAGSCSWCLGEPLRAFTA